MGIAHVKFVHVNVKKAYATENIARIGIELRRKKDESLGFDVEAIEDEDRATTKSFIGECIMHGASVTQSAIRTLDSMDRKGLSTINEDERKRFTDMSKPSTMTIYMTSLVKAASIPNTIDMTSSSSSNSMQSKDSSCETPTLQPEEVKANLAKVMSERVLTCARTNLTSLLKMGKKRSEEEDEEKKEMNTVVKKIRSEMENGSLVATMLDITSNGNDLVNKEDTVESQECLKLLLDFYED